MKIPSLWFVFLLIICNLFLGCTQGDNRETVSISPIIDADTLEHFLASIFQRAHEERNIPGGVFVLVQDDQVQLIKGFGYANVATQRTVAPAETIFRIGSISKAFTALAVMQLVDQGLIDFNEKVSTYIDELPLDEKYEEPIRIWHLLTHTAGFDQLGDRERTVWQPEDQISLGAYLKDHLVQIRPPGRLSTYDTYGITLAGHLIEQVSGLSYTEYMEERIFRPLGMTRTAVQVTAAFRPDLATGYRHEDGAYVAQDYEYYQTTPASSIDATALDMAQFMIAVLGDGGQLFSATMAEQIQEEVQFRNHPQLPGFSYGFWEDLRNGQRAIYHGGTMNGYLSQMYLLPAHK